MLFVHFIDQKQRTANEKVIEVPYEIFRRLVTYTNSVAVSVGAQYYISSVVPISIAMFDNKPFIIFANDRPAERDYLRYHYCIYLLKDI